MLIKSIILFFKEKFQFSTLIRENLNLVGVQVFIILSHCCYLRVGKLVIKVNHVICLNESAFLTQVAHLPQSVYYFIQIKLLELLFVPSPISIQVFECFVESFYCKLATALRKYQIEENIRVPLKKLLIHKDSSVYIRHKELMD